MTVTPKLPLLVTATAFGFSRFLIAMRYTLGHFLLINLIFFWIPIETKSYVVDIRKFLPRPEMEKASHERTLVLSKEALEKLLFEDQAIKITMNKSK